MPFTRSSLDLEPHSRSLGWLRCWLSVATTPCVQGMGSVFFWFLWGGGYSKRKAGNKGQLPGFERWDPGLIRDKREWADTVQVVGKSHSLVGMRVPRGPAHPFMDP